MFHRVGYSAAGHTLERPSFPDNLQEAPLAIGGITPFSTVDCPGAVSTVFYVRGCPFRCPYCHNPSLRETAGPGRAGEDILSFLTQRAGFIETLVLSGGEPLMRLPDIRRIGAMARSLGYRIAMHTTGYYPHSLQSFMASCRLSWVGMDLKADRDGYPGICGKADGYDRMTRSLGLLRESGVPVEVRTTISPEVADDRGLDRLVAAYDELSVERPVWQVMAHRGRTDISLKKRLNDYLDRYNLADRIVLRG